MNKLVAAALLAAGMVAFEAIAQTPASHDAHHGAASPDAAQMTPGEVRKIDRDAGKITLRHDAIASLDMPPMTMVFRVQDPALMDRVKTGDKVRFSAEKIGGQYTVTGIEVVR